MHDEILAWMSTRNVVLTGISAIAVMTGVNLLRRGNLRNLLAEAGHAKPLSTSEARTRVGVAVPLILTGVLGAGTFGYEVFMQKAAPVVYSYQVEKDWQTQSAETVEDEALVAADRETSLAAAYEALATKIAEYESELRALHAQGNFAFPDRVASRP